MDVWYNVNIAQVLNFQISYNVKLSVGETIFNGARKSGEGSSREALPTQPAPLRLFNMLNAPFK